MRILKYFLYFIRNLLLTLIIFPFAMALVVTFKKSLGLKAIWLLWTDFKKFKNLFNIYEINNQSLGINSEKQSDDEKQNKRKKPLKRRTRHI